MSDSVRPHRRQATRLPHPWDSPGKNTVVGCHFLLQCMKVKSESEVAQSCPTLVTPWTTAYQAPPSMGFSRQEYWSGVPLPSPTSHWISVKLNTLPPTHPPKPCLETRLLRMFKGKCIQCQAFPLDPCLSKHPYPSAQLQNHRSIWGGIQRKYSKEGGLHVSVEGKKSPQE